MIRRSLLALVALAPVCWTVPASAADTLPFTPEAFTAAQKAGKSILVHISAPWCGICKAQKPILAKLEADPRFKNLTVFAIDFDSEKEAMRRVGARMQSTLITYKGETETGRSIGETQPEWIEGVLEKAL